MISPSTIKALSTKLQTTEQNVRREYVQHLFLSYLYQQPTANAFYFKGGTALRIAFDSPRFSEDLDFSAKKYNKRELEQTILETLQEIEREGVEVKILESKETSGGHLSKLSFQLGDNTIETLLQFSKRTMRDLSEVVTITNNFIPPYTIVLLERTHLVNEKIQALLTRSKPRDFYDLYFLLRMNLVSRQQKKLLSQAKDILKATTINFEMELKMFLPKSHWAIIRNFKVNLEREIIRFL